MSAANPLDLDYTKVTGRFAATVGDAEDADAYPDIVWCDAGTIRIEPLTALARVVGAAEGPITVGNQVIVATVSSDGRLTYNSQPYVWVVDLTSSKLNPAIPADMATHRVKFAGMSATLGAVTYQVTIPDATIRIAGTGTVDLTTALPLNPGAAVPIIQGPKGDPGAAGAAGSPVATDVAGTFIDTTPRAGGSAQSARADHTHAILGVDDPSRLVQTDLDGALVTYSDGAVALPYLNFLDANGGTGGQLTIQDGVLCLDGVPVGGGRP